MTPDEFKIHEKDWDAAVKRHEQAVRNYRSAESALAVAQAELTNAERERTREWRRLSESTGTRS